MYTETLQSLSKAAISKVAFCRKNMVGYFTASMLAGVYVGVGIALMCAIGGPLALAHSPWLKLVMGASFGIALSLVTIAGAELFTGNNMVMLVGWWQRMVPGRALTAIWGLSWLGNLIGALALAVLLRYSGALEGEAERTLVQGLAAKKMALPVVELLIRGILCNALVCLATWCGYRMKSEAGKLIMIFWCLFAFVATGFEHSVANMTLLSLAMLQEPLPQYAHAFSWQAVAYNLWWASLGNIIGGGIMVGGAYWLASGKPVIADEESAIAPVTSTSNV